MSSNPDLDHAPLAPAINTAEPFRPTTDQEVVDFINHLRAHSTPAHPGAPSAPPPARTAAHHGAPPNTLAHHNQQIRKNEATCRYGNLSPRQLAAARYLIAGYRPTLVAKGLSIDRHTLLRWRRDPQFQAHLHQLHQQLAAKTVAPRRSD